MTIFTTLEKNRRRKLKKIRNRDTWLHAQFDQPKDDYVSDDEKLLDYENMEIEKELDNPEGGAEGGAPAGAGGEKK